MNAIYRKRLTLQTILAAGVFLSLAPVLLPVHAQGKGAAPKLPDLLTLTPAVVPEDPFDPNNQVNAKASQKFRRGDIVRIELHGVLKKGWNTYPITQRTSQQVDDGLTTWTIEKTAGVVPMWPIRETKADTVKTPAGDTWLEFEHEFTWSQDILIGNDAPVGKLQVPVKLDLQICKDTCIPFKNHVVPVSVEVSEEAPLPVSAEVAERIKAAKPAITVVQVAPAPAAKGLGTPKKDQATILGDGLIRDTATEYKVRMEAIADHVESRAATGSVDLLGFILAGIFWGAISLVTPCVFPMIPITVSFFLKQSEKEHHRPVVMASVYSLTIVIVLTLAAAFLLTIFRMLSVNPITNYFIGGVFVYFALSLFGMYEIELPSFIARFTSAREGKGGVEGTIFTALTFTTISFACVAPFLGGFSGTAAAARPWWHNILGGLAFSVTFASPFFLLALFPAFLRKLPKSGSWLNSVKVVMGFLELAAAFKFFRTAELIQTASVPTFFTFDFVLGLWIAMSVLCGLYLLGLFRLPHDTPEDHIGVPRLLFSAVFLALALYLAPALFKVNAAGQSQRPGGVIYAWIDAFLLSESTEGEGETVHTTNLDWALSKAREESKSAQKPKRIFLDFTGVSCTNCKINEKYVFTKTQINKLFDEYLVVKLFTDTVPPDYYAADVRAELARDGRSKRDASVNLWFQKKVFDDERLPLYAVLEPQADGKIRVVGVYEEGRINNEQLFAEFLRHPDGQ